MTTTNTNTVAKHTPEILSDAIRMHKAMPLFYFGYPKDRPDNDNVGHYRHMHLPFGVRLHIRRRFNQKLAWWYGYENGFADGTADQKSRLRNVAAWAVHHHAGGGIHDSASILKGMADRRIEEASNGRIAKAQPESSR